MIQQSLYWAYIQKRQNLYFKKTMYHNIHSSNIYNKQDMEAT